MYSRFTRIAAVFLFFSFGVSWSISQQDDAYRSILSIYSKARNYYDQATAYSYSGNFNEKEEERLNLLALEQFRKLEKYIPRDGKQYDTIRFMAAFRTGELEHYFSQHTAAQQAYGRSIQFHARAGLPDSLLFKPLLYSSIIFYNQGRFDSASLHLDRAEAILEASGNALEEKERLFNLQGVIFFQKGDYRHAGNYFNKALQTLSPGHPYRTSLSINYRINLAQIHMNLQEYDQAFAIYHDLLKEETPPGLLNEVYHNIGSIHINLGAPKRALESFQKIRYTGTKQIRLCNSMASAYMELKNFDSSRILLDSAILLHKKAGKDGDPIAHGISYKLKGDLESLLGDNHKALQFYQAAIRIFYPYPLDTNGNPGQYSGVFSYINLFHALTAKAEVLDKLYGEGKSTAYAIQELDTYRSAFQLLSYVVRTHLSDESRLFMEQTRYRLHSRPIDLCFELYEHTGENKYLELLYEFDQQNKASVLALGIYAAHANPKENSVARKEREVRQEISRLSLQAAQTTNDSLLTAISREMTDREIELEKIQEKPGYQQPLIRIPAISHLQKNVIEKGTTIVSYHLSGSSLTTFVITGKNFYCHQQALFEGFHEALKEQVNHAIELHAGTIHSEKLFHFLLKAVPLDITERLIIIPDDELNYLPFESLFNGKTYLVQQVAVQYQYATSLLKKERISLSEHSTAAYAPYASQSFPDSLMPMETLPHSAYEIEGLKGNLFVDRQASKEQFLKNLNDHQVIHLATHARVNNANNKLSFIAFSPEQGNDHLLFSEEIYHLPLNQVKLVILSACETGAGNLVRGEGIMSLSRAFYYAGCSNMITSLWKANDFSTAYIMKRVHQYLDEDLTIDLALQKAKADYLNDASINPRMKHPYFWAHLVFTGNYEPTHTSAGVVKWIIWITIFTIASVTWIIFRKKRKKLI